jgi:hypothetical protein
MPGSDAADHAAAAVLDPDPAAELGIGAELVDDGVGAEAPEVAPARAARSLEEVEGRQHRPGRSVEELVGRAVEIRGDELVQPVFGGRRRLEQPRDEQDAGLARHQPRRRGAVLP